MAENYLPNSSKKSNRNSNLFKFSRKLKKFDVSGVSVLEHILNRLEKGEILDHKQTFNAIFSETEKLKALGFLFANLTLNEESDYNNEAKNGIVELLEGIAENIEKLVITFAKNERITAIEI
jgi:hypothetical protein